MNEPVMLHPDDRRLLQEVAALLRGLMAAIPRPVPPGDWGRSSGSPGPSVRGPVAVPVVVSEPKAVPIGRRSKHTPESIAKDAQDVERWLRLAGVSGVRLAAEAGMNATLLSNVKAKREGLSINARARFAAAVDRLRARRAAR